MCVCMCVYVYICTYILYMETIFCLLLCVRRYASRQSNPTLNVYIVLSLNECTTYAPMLAPRQSA